MVLGSARSKLDALAVVAGNLNDASDEFTAQLRTIEAELAKLAVGIEVEHDDGIESQPGMVCYLGYRRLGNNWRLVVRVVPTTMDSAGESWLPLLEAPRNVRIAAAPLIDDLLTLILVEARKKLTALKTVGNPQMRAGSVLSRAELMARPRMRAANRIEHR